MIDYEKRAAYLRDMDAVLQEAREGKDHATGTAVVLFMVCSAALGVTGQLTAGTLAATIVGAFVGRYVRTVAIDGRVKKRAHELIRKHGPDVARTLAQRFPDWDKGTAR